MKAIVVAAAAALALSAGVASADEALAKDKKCMSCHQVEKKVVGPAFKDIAKKYKGDAKAVEHNVQVIKKGGKGVWGAVPMPPHPQVSDADAEKLAKWVLSL
ncbi:MAG: cytochrome c transmembrane protein [bacterium]|nr:MAG: cytochrome c transmembrane protein [bacterium]KAF0149300.1 MAG: cytochrome c transmembrane protein [bacterium]KAF0169822.1 MAG: cytochrome c transmembrane protein [bacterium]TXT22746.1 MAG: cytochrome c transmembrane protein [bacterium]